MGSSVFGMDEWDPVSMEEAYVAGWDDFYNNGYMVGGGGTSAEATSHLYWDEWLSQHHYYVSDSRVLEAQTSVPTTLFDIVELAIPFWSYAADSGGYHWPDTFECSLNGNWELSRFGTVGWDYFSGWVAWGGAWNGDIVSFDLRWDAIDIGYWGGAHLHDDYLYVHVETYFPLICGFAFDDLDGHYRNFDWSPIADWEW
jgi:hypothetical protein